MNPEPLSLSVVFDGWDGYNTSIAHAIAPLTQAQLDWRPAPHLRSVGETAAHLAVGRVTWFARTPAPGSLELMEQAQAQGAASGADAEKVIAGNREAILRWLDASWQMIDATLRQWTTADLARSYRHEYQGRVYAVSYQWTVWRVLTHDIHHGGELAVMLGQQGIAIPELGDLFGHLTMPPFAR